MFWLFFSCLPALSRQLQPPRPMFIVQTVKARCNAGHRELAHSHPHTAGCRAGECARPQRAKLMLVHTFDANKLPVNSSEAVALCCSLEEA